MPLVVHHVHQVVNPQSVQHHVHYVMRVTLIKMAEENVQNVPLIHTPVLKVAKNVPRAIEDRTVTGGQVSVNPVHPVNFLTAPAYLAVDAVGTSIIRHLGRGVACLVQQVMISLFIVILIVNLILMLLLYLLLLLILMLLLYLLLFIVIVIYY